MFSKLKRKQGVKTNKVKIELCAVTPFGMALNPMVSSYVREDNSMLRFVCIDNRGVLKIFKMHKPGQVGSRKSQSAVTDMELTSVATHTGLSLVRELLTYGRQLIGFDITG